MTPRQEQFALDMAREVIDAEDRRQMGHTYTAITLARALVYAREPKPFRWPHEVQEFGAGTEPAGSHTPPGKDQP